MLVAQRQAVVGLVERVVYNLCLRLATALPVQPPVVVAVVVGIERQAST